MALFQTSTAGEVRAIRFYKATGNGGVHTGSLWGPNGQRLATVTFANETATGVPREPDAVQTSQAAAATAAIPGSRLPP